MRAAPIVLFALLLAGSAAARDPGFGLDAFNRVVPVSAPGPAVFSPLSFEIDSVIFAEAVDPIRRSLFANALRVTDDFESEYRPLARAPFECPGTNGLALVWAHALVVDEPRQIDPSYRLTVQELYGAEVCRAAFAYGIEAWVKTRFAGDLAGWRLPPLSAPTVFAFHDLVSLSAGTARTNGLRRVCPTHTVYRLPLDGGTFFYAVVPKSGRPVASVRARVTSATLPEILSMPAAVMDPPESVRVALPAMDFTVTNELAGAFSYFKLPTSALKPFPPGLRPCSLRQTMRFRLKAAPPAEGEVPLDGPFLFFIHDPVANTLPVAGVYPGKGEP